MNRVPLVALVLAVLVGIGVLWLTMRDEPSRAGERTPVAEDAEPRPATEAVAAELEVVAPDEPVRDEIEAESEPEPAEPTVEAEEPAPAEVPDLEAVDWIEIRVIDDRDQPVRDAEVEIYGMRSASDPGSWYGYRDGENPTAKTDWEGRVRLGYWVWVNQDGRTNAVDLKVTHPDFIAFRDSSYELGPGEHTVVLRRGPTVVVSAWIDSPSLLVKDVKIQIDIDAKMQPDAWKPEPDGRWSTDRIPPGPHLLLVRHESEEHGKCFSEVTPFELDEAGYVEVDVELLPAARLEGVLDPIVPRPIVDGHVMLVIQHGENRYQMPTIYRDFETDVDAEGAFAFEGLPRGRGQLFASCVGWVSRRTLADSAADAGIRFGKEPTAEKERQALERLGDRAFQPQRVRIPGERYTVLMEETGAVEITVKLEDGTPLEGATVHASPNVQFIGYGSIIVPWREFHATTDRDGRGLIAELPADDSLWIGAQHADYQMSKEDRTNYPSVRIVAGETARAELVLVAK